MKSAHYSKMSWRIKYFSFFIKSIWWKLNASFENFPCRIKLNKQRSIHESFIPVRYYTADAFIQLLLERTNEQTTTKNCNYFRVFQSETMLPLEIIKHIHSVLENDISKIEQHTGIVNFEWNSTLSKAKGRKFRRKGEKIDTKNIKALVGFKNINFNGWNRNKTLIQKAITSNYFMFFFVHFSFNLKAK